MIVKKVVNVQSLSFHPFSFDWNVFQSGFPKYITKKVLNFEYQLLEATIHFFSVEKRTNMNNLTIKKSKYEKFCKKNLAMKDKIKANLLWHVLKTKLLAQICETEQDK